MKVQEVLPGHFECDSPYREINECFFYCIDSGSTWSVMIQTLTTNNTFVVVSVFK